MSEADQNQTVDILDTRPKPFVFVLMPFDERFTDVYELGIKVACEKAGAYAQRLDEQIFGESMLQRIYNQIAKADVIVADMTARNPNVFYEVGYAHALGKVVVLLTHDKDDIPFDLKHYRHILYENVTGLLPQLETAVRWAVKQASEKTRPMLPLRVYCNERPLVDAPTIDVPYAVVHTWCDVITLRITCENADEVNAIGFGMALWTSDRCVQCDWHAHRESTRPIYRPERGYIFNAPAPVSLLPGQWAAVEAAIHVKLAAESCHNIAEQIILRISAQSGSYNYPFTVKTR